MGRLIDADVFEEFIRNKYADGEKTEDVKEQMLFDLSYQQTAYDPDKVVEQLEDCSIWKELLVYELTHREREIVKRAIEIVKGGGVNDR